MDNLKRKYARFLLEYCLQLKNNDKVFIIGSKEITDFIDILIDEASNMHLIVKTYINDYQRQRELLMSKDYEYLIKDENFDKTIYNELAKSGYAFLSLSSPMPDYFSGVDDTLLSRVNAYQQSSISLYRTMQLDGSLKWNISAVPNSYWAKSLNVTTDELWNMLFSICGITSESVPASIWNEKLKKLNQRKDYLNSLDISNFHYTNSLGTDLYIYLPEDYLFCAADEGNLVNLPTEEVFSSPEYSLTKGIVYASKPLIYNGITISDFYLEFSGGRVINYGAKEGLNTLKGILSTDEGSKYLGEVALVDNTSTIAKMNFLFKNTLLDENSSCHLALGDGFMECRKNGYSMSKEELHKSVNHSINHVDFFIGTNDLNITATLRNKKEIVIMENGLFKGEMK